MKLAKELRLFIERAREFGLPGRDVENAEMFLEHHEYGLCFETLVEQLYEYDIPIDRELVTLAASLGSAMKYESESWVCLEELVP